MTNVCIVPRCNHGQPREAGAGRYACPHCVTALRHTLRGIEVYTSILAIITTPLQGRGERRTPGYGSRPPTNLDRVVALDYRSRTGGDGPDDDDQPPRSILRALNGIANAVREHADEPGNARPTVTGEIGYLIYRLEWCARLDWIDDLANDLRDLHTQLRRQAGDQPPRPIGHCPTLLPDGECSTPLYMPTRGDTVHCRNCGRAWPRPEWEHLAALLNDTRRAG